MTLAGASGMRLASEHRPMGGADLGSARRGGAFGGALEQRWEYGPPRGAARYDSAGMSGERQAQGCRAFAHLALLILQSMTNMQSMTNGCPT